MKNMIEKYCQIEYARILDSHNARKNNFTHSDCEDVLIEAGATYEQAKNGAYVYLHHGLSMTATKRGSQEEYDQILDQLKASSIRPIDCIAHLENLGYSYGQAKSAVNKYRKRRGLIT